MVSKLVSLMKAMIRDGVLTEKWGNKARTQSRPSSYTLQPAAKTVGARAHSQSVRRPPSATEQSELSSLSKTRAAREQSGRLSGYRVGSERESVV